MVAVTPPENDAADLLKNLSLDTQTKTSKILDPVKSVSVDPENGQIQPNNQPATPGISDFMDPTSAYYPNGYPSTAYYYGGYDGTAYNWDEYSRYLNSCGYDLAHGVYGYGYTPYGNYSSASSPMPTVAYDGQLYGSQHYPYSSPYLLPPTSTETVKPGVTHQPPLAAGTTKKDVGNGTGFKENTGSGPVKPTQYPNSAYSAHGSYGMGAQNGYLDLGLGYDGLYTPVPWFEGPMFTDPQTANKDFAPKTQTHIMGPHSSSGMNTSSGYTNKMYPNKIYTPYVNTYRSGYGYGGNTYGLQNNGRSRSQNVDNKLKTGFQANSFFGRNSEYDDGLNELNRGPRAGTTKNQRPMTSVALANKDQDTSVSPINSVEHESTEVKEVNVTPDREQYNKVDFPETYTDAKFHIIKSYSEDDVHRSIKYNVWASTPNGNKKLDAAYHEAQQKSEKCPVFLFFSVNTSGQFVGVAEMVGPVDFTKSLEYWQQDKWIGCFPVKWHIVKDLPNNLLKHIILENNDNKPVTNSRDTQEVNLAQGLQMIKIFKDHSSKQCVLDDFEFYEERQKRILDKKAKQRFQKQAWEKKQLADKKIEEAEEANEVVTKSDDDVSDSVKAVSLADNVQDDEDDDAKPEEKKVTVNGTAAKGC